jgi:alpha-beta hydrolase superfamily lysophospholipase
MRRTGFDQTVNRISRERQPTLRSMINRMSLATPHQFQFTSTDGLRIVYSRWTNGRRPRGILQIAHGMGEHVGRYFNLIETLVNAGLVVYGNDHRGHGRTAPSTKQLGDFGPGGFNLLVEDMVRLSVIAKEENPGQPFILLGHSLGSFAAQKFALDHSCSIEGLALSGSGALDELARLAKSASQLEDILNARFLPARTAFDWLSRDPAVADAFVNDPLCFEKLQPGPLESFLAAGRELADPRNLHRIRPDLPIYLFSGSEDPIGLQLKGVRLLMERYQKAGVANISHHFYSGGRHEMLNETNRGEVITNLILWISEVLKW